MENLSDEMTWTLYSCSVSGVDVCVRKRIYLPHRRLIHRTVSSDSNFSD